MNKLLINFFSAKSGGGKVILDNFMEHFDADDVEIHFIFPSEYDFKFEKHLEVKVPKWMNKPYGLFWFYFFFVPNYCRKNGISKVLNFGDVIFPRLKSQTYFFDWAYLVLDDSNIWSSMDFKSRFIRMLKAALIKAFKSNNKTVIVQSEAISSSYKKILGFEGEIVVAPTPVSINNIDGMSHGIDKNSLVYISNYAPHKNFEIIPRVASILKQNKVDCSIVLTIDENSIHWRNLSCELSGLGVLDMVKTLGPLSQEDVFSVLKSSRALFFPSKLESYGIPLIEAMILGKPVLTSDTPFIKSVCGDAVLYFDPKCPEDIATKITDFIDGVDYCRMRQSEVSKVLENIPSWDQYTRLLIKSSI
ncbi:conserved hypothetical protein [Vibrio vulnificus YJ016]|uniref:Glycosyl transferase family 1 domain-containing protein n=1 Tax=Vibrio vulnificus (strain YJ016) TaxID=196600 RepID=Q7MPL5_VIBVY|nr:glycosyltransferase [Vibrio vulnificus]PWY34165.1 hypothetical protein VV86_09560 [Vibrio vulnificus]BAC93112.1 conserved hypothetical protein [Vibrio vulnificus YJ016]HAS6025462.1 glycosyltransferase [Vibrio vulnificus]HAS6036438.1 glycosyltransferase [Vibrio vulnificus]